MGWFKSQTEFERQLEIYDEQSKVMQEELAELQGVDTPQNEIRRGDIEEELAKMEIAQEQIRQSIREQEEMEKEQDYFND